MAEDFLEEIYEEAYAVTKLRYIVELARKGYATKIKRYLDEVMPILDQITIKCSRTDGIQTNSVQERWKCLSGMTENMIALGDYVEAEVIPYCQKYLQQVNSICVEDEDGFCLESSRSAFLTIQNTTNNLFFHSVLDPMWEARKLVETFYDPKMQSYSLLGNGLGYIAYQLYCISDGSIKIHLFEYDEKMVFYARHYGVLDWIPEECLEVTVDSDIMAFLQSITDEKVGHYIFKPEIDMIPADAKRVMDEIIINDNTASFFYDDLKRNFYKNTNSGILPISNYDKASTKNAFIVVAGGPSLDESLEFIKSQKGIMTIVAVGTVFRKLIECGIQPDLVTMMDPQKEMLKQLEGVENQKVPLLLSTISYWGLGSRYQGEKYLVSTRSILEESEKYALEHGMEIWDCAGTVTMMAIETAVYFGAKEIYLVGTDFAYPGGMSHATGTPERVKMNQSKLFPTESVNGGIVYTDTGLNLFRCYLEEFIASNLEAIYINMSPSGAKIAGTQWMNYRTFENKQ